MYCMIPDPLSPAQRLVKGRLRGMRIFFFCKPQPQLVSDQKPQASQNKIDPCREVFYSCLKLFSHAEAFYSCLKLYAGSFLFMLEAFSHAEAF